MTLKNNITYDFNQIYLNEKCINKSILNIN